MTWYLRMSMIFGICSMNTGQISTHAAQVVAAVDLAEAVDRRGRVRQRRLGVPGVEQGVAGVRRETDGGGGGGQQRHAADPTERPARARPRPRSHIRDARRQNRAFVRP